MVPDGITTRQQTRDGWRALSELHSAPRWLWKPLVAKLVAEGWTVLTAARLCL